MIECIVWDMQTLQVNVEILQHEQGKHMHAQNNVYVNFHCGVSATLIFCHKWDVREALAVY